jgi:lysophospholipase L1-like esterase
MVLGAPAARPQEPAGRPAPPTPGVPALPTATTRPPGMPPARRWPPAPHDRVPHRPGRFEGEIRAFENADYAAPPPAGAVLFVGSSSIKHWASLQDDFEGVPVLNRGFGGSELEDVIHYAKRIVLPYHARRVVVYAGDNDLHAGKSPEDVFADFRTLVYLIRRRQPRTPIAFLSIKPSPARWDRVEQVRRANELIHDYCEARPYLEYIDVFTPMLGPDGRPRPELYQPDGLHLTPAGYAVWAEELSLFVRASRGPMAMGSSRGG